MKISEINEIFEIKSNNAIKPEINDFENFDKNDFGSMGISSVNSKAQKQSKQKENPSNYFVNLSKDDAESIINLLKDYVTL